MDKIQSSISSIKVDNATFKNKPKTINPTFVNFFFGNNGTGKSTIAKNIKDCHNLVFTSDVNTNNTDIFLYNEDFIKDTIKLYENMPGVFSAGKESNNILKQIEIKEKAKDEYFVKKKHNDFTLENLENEVKNIDDKFKEACWNETKGIRDVFDEAIDNNHNKNNFMNDMLNADTSKTYNYDNLQKQYDIIYNEDAPIYNTIPVFTEDEITVLDIIASNPLLKKPITSSADLPFGDFMKKLNATLWVRDGYNNYHNHYGDKCPFCQQKLPEDFEKTINACFDSQYENDINDLNKLITSYKNKANELIDPIELFIRENDVFPDIDIKRLNDKISGLKGLVIKNIETLNEKLSMPAKVVEIPNIAPQLKDLYEMINESNKMINENNQMVQERENGTDVDSFKKKVIDYIASTIKTTIELYKAGIKDKKADIVKMKQQQDIDRQNLEGMRKEIEKLNSSIINTQESRININNLLIESNFQGFRVEPKNNAPNMYQIMRMDGSPAVNLSEGERNFIAFLYFYHMVMGSTTPEGLSKDKIVIIDDPVCSLDSSSLFIVSSLIREMIEICENNAIKDDRSTEKRFIKQIFILTHNAYFHREVTYNQLKYYEFVNFYLIRKNDNESDIKLCEMQNPNEPTKKINVNPVKNSYSSLWEEYKDLHSPIPLMNVIRRILEYYFLQLCGYDGKTLRTTILKNNKDNFIKQTENGNEDLSDYQLVSAMLSYINTAGLNITDGLNYVDDCGDEQQCRRLFKKIFELMKQDQHYKMMTGEI